MRSATMARLTIANASASWSAVGRRLIDVPGYIFRVWVTNRTEGAATLAQLQRTRDH